MQFQKVDWDRGAGQAEILLEGGGEEGACCEEIYLGGVGERGEESEVEVGVGWCFDCQGAGRRKVRSCCWFWWGRLLFANGSGRHGLEGEALKAKL